MVYNGIAITLSWAFVQTKEAFKKHEAHHGLSDKQLNEWWALIQAKKKQANVDDLQRITESGKP